MYLTTQEVLDAYQHFRQRQFADTTIEGGGSLSLAGCQLTRLDLRNAILSEVNMIGANLDAAIMVNVVCHGAQFQRASLQRASLREINWQRQNLEDINAQGANFMHAQLQYASFRGANVQRANFTAANLRGANLIGADLRSAILGTAVLEEVVADATTQWPDTKAFKQVRLSSGMTIAQLTGRSEAVQAEEEQDLIPMPGRGSTLLPIAKIQEAIREDWHRRPEQPAFRRSVLQVCRERCVISGSDVPDGLEAAHIVPYAVAQKEDKNFYTNGLLLRADLHKLFDQGRLTIDPDSGIIYLDEQLQQSPAYQHWHKACVTLPEFPPAIIYNYEAHWRDNLRWRQQYYQDLLDGGSLLAR
jgi:hypothetical protein